MSEHHKPWALILGGTGGFGLATARILSSRGYSLALVFRERRVRLDALEPEFERFRAAGSLLLFNLNANEETTQDKVIETLLQEIGSEGSVKFLLHAIADGNLKSLFGLDASGKEAAQPYDFSRTIDAMGTGMYVWTRRLVDAGLMKGPASVVGMTSEGTFKVLPAYAAVGAAKAVLESNMKYMAAELAQSGIRVNLINAGITDTNALKVFPTYGDLLNKAGKRNPSGRLTTPEDVAPVIAFLASEDSAWITGSIITVDGGEQLISLY